MKKLIINVTEEYMEIAEVTTFLQYISVPKIVNFIPVATDIKSGYDNKENTIAFKSLLLKNKIIVKNAEVVLSIDGVITRLVEVPYMSEKDLKNYIDNNIEQYFTVSVEDYFFDYKIVEVLKKQKKFLNILLVAVPKEKLNDIKSFIKNCGLNLSSINIYPECIGRIFGNYKDNSVAVLDAGSKRSSITILDNGKIFVYSIINVDLNDENNYEELLDNLSYFLNFYASRHFGKKLDKVFVTGEFSQINSFISYLASNIDGTVNNEIKELGLKISIGKDINTENYIELFGATLNRKNIHSKEIDFKNAISPKKYTNNNYNKQIAIAVGLIFLVNALLFSYKFYNLKQQLKQYSTPLVNTENTSDYETQKNAINKEIEKYKLRGDYITQIKSDEFDYISILDTLMKGLPKNIAVKSIKLDKQDVTLVLSINNSTIDAAKAVIAVNKMNIFETYDFSDVKLDDSVKEITLNLKIKKS